MWTPFTRSVKKSETLPSPSDLWVRFEPSFPCVLQRRMRGQPTQCQAPAQDMAVAACIKPLRV